MRDVATNQWWERRNTLKKGCKIDGFQINL